MDETFIEERRQSLEHFINEVCHNEKLASTIELQVLLTGSPEGLVAAKEMLPLLPSATTRLPMKVTSLWGTMKEGFGLSSAVQQIDIKTDESYKEIGEHISEYEKRILKVVSSSEVVYQTQRAQGYELSRFGVFLTELSVHEREDEEISALFECVGKKFDQVSNLFQDKLDESLLKYLTPVRYQAGKVESIKVVMKNRENAIGEVQKANASLHRNKERFAAARASSGATSSALAAEKKMELAETKMNSAKEQVAFIADSLKLESQQFSKDKAQEFKDALIALADIQCTYFNQAREQWAMILPTLTSDPQLIQQSLERIRKRIQFEKPNGRKSIGLF